MSTIGLFLYLSVLRLSIYFLCRGAVGEHNGRRLLAFLIVALGCALPFIFMEEGVVEKTVANLLLSGISVFYFAFLIGRLRKI